LAERGVRSHRAGAGDVVRRPRRARAIPKLAHRGPRSCAASARHVTTSAPRRGIPRRRFIGSVRKRPGGHRGCFRASRASRRDARRSDRARGRTFPDLAVHRAHAPRRLGRRRREAGGIRRRSPAASRAASWWSARAFSREAWATL
jgi:hypothetical protein